MQIWVRPQWRKIFVAILKQKSYWVIPDDDDPLTFVMSRDDEGNYPVGSFRIAKWSPHGPGPITLFDAKGNEMGCVTFGGDVYRDDMIPGNRVGSFQLYDAGERLMDKDGNVLSGYPQCIIQRSVLRGIHAFIYLRFLVEIS